MPGSSGIAQRVRIVAPCRILARRSPAPPRRPAAARARSAAPGGDWSVMTIARAAILHLAGERARRVERRQMRHARAGAQDREEGDRVDKACSADRARPCRRARCRGCISPAATRSARAPSSAKERRAERKLIAGFGAVRGHHPVEQCRQGGDRDRRVPGEAGRIAPLPGEGARAHAGQDAAITSPNSSQLLPFHFCSCMARIGW